jgi:hypothetical protein
MGNVRAEDIVTIWNNQTYQDFRATIYTPEMPEECRTCIRREWQMIPSTKA